MKKFVWPDHLKFDDTDEDLKEARKFWFDHRCLHGSGDIIADLVEFIELYAQRVEAVRNIRHKDAC
jgi:hypothetical protein